MKRNLLKPFFTVFLPVLALAACSRGLSPLSEEVEIEGSVATLSGDVLRPEIKGKSKCPVAIIYHGLTGYRAEPHLVAVCDSLLYHGVAVVRFDFNGHGKSGGEFVDMTLGNEFGDAIAVYDYVSSLPWADRKNISIIGHSQGGLEAGMVAGELGEGKISAAVLLSPAPCLHTMALRGDIFGSGFDPEDVPEYIEFWGGSHLGRAYIEGAAALDPYGRTAPYSGPVLIIQGMNENRTLIEDSMKYRDILSDCRYETLEGFTHCYGEDVSVPAHMVSDFVLSHLR